MGTGMGRTNYFVEGLQGAGKSTLVRLLSGKLKDYEVFHEGDYSPVDLAWCAYVTEEQYRRILADYPALCEEIGRNTVTEGSRKIICYTRILTEVPDFYKNMEEYEIYNGKRDRDSFERVVLERFRNWNGEGQIFECAMFQNIITDQMLYLGMTDGEILDFYGRLKDVLGEKPYRIVYLDMEDIAGGIGVIRKERSDGDGNEMWFPLMVRYLEESPYGKEHALKGLEGLLRHLEERRTLERRLLETVFKERAVILEAKNYDLARV